jgi:hypothetical protein
MRRPSAASSALRALCQRLEQWAEQNRLLSLWATKDRPQTGQTYGSDIFVITEVINVGFVMMFGYQVETDG